MGRYSNTHEGLKQKKDTTVTLMSTVKLVTLLIKTVSKPMANALKRKARTNEFFHSVCFQLAQGYNRMDMKLKQNFLDYKSEIKPLSEQKAIEMGSNFVAEFILFLVGAGCIFGEAYRSSLSNKNKRDLLQKQIEELEEKLGILEQKTHDMESEWKSLDLGSLREMHQKALLKNNM
jgi:hypothetical protein